MAIIATAWNRQTGLMKIDHLDLDRRSYSSKYHVLKMLAKMHDVLTVVWSTSLELPTCNNCLLKLWLHKHSHSKQFKIIRGGGGGGSGK